MPATLVAKQSMGAKLVSERKRDKKKEEERQERLIAAKALAPINECPGLSWDIADEAIRMYGRNNSSNRPVSLVSYNHDQRKNDTPYKPIKMDPKHAFQDFTSEVERFRSLEKNFKHDLSEWKNTCEQEYGLTVEGDDPVTMSWMLYLEGPNPMATCAPAIRDAIEKRREEILAYIRGAVGANEDGTDSFALDWKDDNKNSFNDKSRMFPIYLPGICIKLCLKGAHITGPKNVEDFVGVAEFVRGFFTLVSRDSRPHHLHSFNMTMMNVPIKMHVSDARGVFKSRTSIYSAFDEAMHEATTKQTGPMWDNHTNRVCMKKLRFDSLQSSDENEKKYAGVNFRYLVHNKTEPGLTINGKERKWPWISIFEKGKMIIILNNPAVLFPTIKFIVELMSNLVEVNEDKDKDNDKAMECSDDEEEKEMDEIYREYYDEDD